MHPAWARSVRDQCVAEGVPFFFKQWGQYQPRGGLDGEAYEGWAVNMDRIVAVAPDGRLIADDAWHWAPRGSWAMESVGKKAAGRLLDGREWNEYPKLATGY
jgi:protein gp37